MHVGNCAPKSISYTVSCCPIRECTWSVESVLGRGEAKLNMNSTDHVQSRIGLVADCVANISGQITKYNNMFTVAFPHQ
jgi:hypothetical protein